MSALSDKDLQTALKLEADRRSGPLNEKGQPVHFDINDKKYQEWMIRYGYLLISEIAKQRGIL